MKDLKFLIKQLTTEEFVFRGLDKAGRIVEREAKRKAPSVTGELKSTISHHRIGMTEYIGTNLPTAPYVEYGTGIHAVKGNGRPTPWAYEVKGTYAKVYWSPEKKNCFLDEGRMMIWTWGQKPQPYLEPALTENMQEILKLFNLDEEKDV